MSLLWGLLWVGDSGISSWKYSIECVRPKLFQLYPTLCNPMDCSLQGSSIHGILQARILEWIAMPSSRGIFPTQGLIPHLLCLLQWQAGFFFFLPLVPPGKSFHWIHYYRNLCSVTIKRKWQCQAGNPGLLVRVFAEHRSPATPPLARLILTQELAANRGHR